MGIIIEVLLSGEREAFRRSQGTVWLSSATRPIPANAWNKSWWFSYFAVTGQIHRAGAGRKVVEIPALAWPASRRWAVCCWPFFQTSLRLWVFL